MPNQFTSSSLYRSVAQPCVAILLVLLAGTLCGCLSHDEAAPKEDAAPAKPKPDPTAWQPLFNGKSLDSWKITQFGGEGEIKVEDGQLLLSFGSPLTGITWKDEDKLPKTNYEIRLQAQRVDGVDFFCCLTFPVNDSYCSLVLGGWGGTVTGISSIDSYDAENNETAEYHEFTNGKWYRVRVRVTPDKIQAWVDDEKIVDVETKDRKFSTRIEVEPSEPLGVASYQTTAAIKDFEIRRLPEK